MRRAQLSQSVVYVAEATTGNVSAYAIPWSRAAYSAGRTMPPQPFVAVPPIRFRSAGNAVPIGP